MLQGLRVEQGPDGLERIVYRSQGYQFWDWRDEQTGTHRIHYISAGVFCLHCRTFTTADRRPLLLLLRGIHKFSPRTPPTHFRAVLRGAGPACRRGE